MHKPETDSPIPTELASNTDWPTHEIEAVVVDDPFGPRRRGERVRAPREGVLWETRAVDGVEPERVSLALIDGRVVSVEVESMRLVEPSTETEIS